MVYIIGMLHPMSAVSKYMCTPAMSAARDAAAGGATELQLFYQFSMCTPQQFNATAHPWTQLAASRRRSLGHATKPAGVALVVGMVQVELERALGDCCPEGLSLWHSIGEVNPRPDA